MGYYLLQIGYTAEAWAGLVKRPQNRVNAVRPVIEKLGGRIEGSWLAFGKYDVVAILQMPDNVSAAALAMAFSAGGATKALKTTPLMTWEEGVRAMKKAGAAGYRPPGK